MSLTPVPPPLPETPVLPRRSWQSRLLIACLAIFTFEIGLFLLIFPWLDNWNLNYFSGILPSLPDWWDQPAFRGALSGLGIVNIYVAMRQTVRIFQK